MTDKDVMAIAFFEKSLRFFGEDISEKEHAELEEDLPEYAANIIEWGGFDLRERIKALEAENERLREALRPFVEISSLLSIEPRIKSLPVDAEYLKAARTVMENE